jgi:hypothetical protein
MRLVGRTEYYFDCYVGGVEWQGRCCQFRFTGLQKGVWGLYVDGSKLNIYNKAKSGLDVSVSHPIRAAEAVNCVIVAESSPLCVLNWTIAILIRC